MKVLMCGQLPVSHLLSSSCVHLSPTNLHLLRLVRPPDDTVLLFTHSLMTAPGLLAITRRHRLLKDQAKTERGVLVVEPLTRRHGWNPKERQHSDIFNVGLVNNYAKSVFFKCNRPETVQSKSLEFKLSHAKKIHCSVSFYYTKSMNKYQLMAFNK